MGQACRIRFSVQDTGIGIPESRQETLFAAFTQVDASITRKYGGTGLGLAISSQLVQLMGGKMAVSSAVGEGSEFSFSIRTTVQPDRGNLQLSPDKLAQIRGKTVLVVEDNETHLKLLNIKLTRWGVETICVQDGKQAKALIDQPIALDLVLTDLFLPEVDGQELAEYLQQQRPKTPVILFSSLGSIQPMKETGLFEAVLAKPLRQKAVFRAIFQALFPEESGVPQTDKPNLEANQPPNAPLPGRLLLAEDNLVNQKLALRMLEKLGYQAEVANNGLEAIAKLNEQVFDIILMDVQMPGLDGLEATRRIREEFPPDLQPIIIAMTANAMKGDREMCIDAGMDDYISKPFRMAKLGEMLQQYLAAIHVSK
ncbi:MAG: response regulator [Bacteroidota bacterium]